MKKLVFFLLNVLFSLSGQAQIVSIPNAAFKSVLLASNSGNFIARDLNGDYFAIDANTNNEIEESEAIQVAYLEIGSSTISSLNGIEYFTNLVSLRCENNQINTLNVSNLLFLTYLDCSNNQLNFLNISGLTELAYLNCQFNSLTNLNANGITNLTILDCSYNSITNINLIDLISLETLNCSNNQIQSFDLVDLVSLKELNCSYNVLTSINTTNLSSLESLNCSNNQLQLITLISLNNLSLLECQNNLLTSLNLINLPSFTTLNCNFNQLPSLVVNDLISLKTLSCTNNYLTSLNLNGLALLENVDCQNNQLISIENNGLVLLSTLNCNNNQLTSIDVINLTNIKYLYLNNNLLNELTITGLSNLQVLSCINNSINNLNFSDLNNLQTVYCSNNQITILDLSDAYTLQSLFCDNNLLSQLFIKNGSNENFIQFNGNPNLVYICGDELDLDYIQIEIDANGYSCVANSYCSFIPGGTIYTFQGNSKFDSESNGCSITDSNFPNIKLSISDGVSIENLISNTTGNYSQSFRSGSYVVTPTLENPNYFTVSPASLSLDFPTNSSPYVQDFCIIPNGNHSDLEIVILPLSTAIPGEIASYKISFKNKGTTTQSGSINVNFNTTEVSYLNANPTVTSQNSGNLIWSFTNLLPLESRSIQLQLNINSSTVSSGQNLNYLATITSSNTDEMPNDNSSVLNQIVTTTSETNDKICLEGNTISTSQVGEYMHYIIRFKNTGSSVAQNVVIKDIIDISKFDITSLFPNDASHFFTSKIKNENEVEFIFENINLSNTINNNNGFVAFKIKTLPTLDNGDNFTNSARIYFDYKAPIITNNATTVIQTLNSSEFENDKFIIFPNPVQNNLFIQSKTNIVPKSISIYNSIGQVVLLNTDFKTNSIDVSLLKSGVYYLQIKSEKATESKKFVKQ